MKKPDLLILIAIWEFLTALGAFIGVIAIAVFAFPQVTMLGNIARVGGLFGLSVGMVLLLAYLALSAIAGIGLIMGKEWGRISAIIHAAVSLLRIPFGTIIGILALIYLVKPEVKEYFQTAEQ